MKNSLIRTAFFVSGGGSTMDAVLGTVATGELKGIYPACVVASKPQIGALEKATARGMPQNAIHVLEKKSLGVERFGDEILKILRMHEVDLVSQNGWLPMTPDCVVEAYEGRIINQHPGPLDPGYPDFGGHGMYGKRVHCARLIYAKATECDWWTEATVHRVAKADPKPDRGALLLKRQVSIYPGDTVDALQQRVLPIEHHTVIEALRMAADGRLQDFERPDRVIRSGRNLDLLTAAKETAIREYPRG